MSWPYMPHQCSSCRYFVAFDPPAHDDRGYELPGACAHPRIGMELFVARGDPRAPSRRLRPVHARPERWPDRRRPAVAAHARPGVGILVGGDEARLHARSPALMASADVEANREAVSQHRRRSREASCSARGIGALARGGLPGPSRLPGLRVLRRGRGAVLPLVRDRVVRRSADACAPAAIGRFLPAPRAARAAGATAGTDPRNRPRRAGTAREPTCGARRVPGVRECAAGARAV